MNFSGVRVMLVLTIILWAAIITTCNSLTGCTTVMVQVGNDNNSDDSVKVRRKIELDVDVKPNRQEIK
jgi:hypothetical protein